MSFEVNFSPTNEKTFVADDLNFTDYSKEKLTLLCKYQLLIQSRYPKLIVGLYFHPQFKNWLTTLKEKFNEETIINNLVLGLELYQKNNPESLKIELEDGELWKSIVEPFLVVTEFKKIDDFKKTRKSQTKKKKVRYVKI